jgi:hypothetical protein
MRKKSLPAKEIVHPQQGNIITFEAMAHPVTKINGIKRNKFSINLRRDRAEILYILLIIGISFWVFKRHG